MCYTRLLRTTIPSLRHCWSETRTNGDCCCCSWLPLQPTATGSDGVPIRTNRWFQVPLNGHWRWAPTCLGTAHVTNTALAATTATATDWWISCDVCNTTISNHSGKTSGFFQLPTPRNETTCLPNPKLALQYFIETLRHLTKHFDGIDHRFTFPSRCAVASAF